MRKVFSHGEMDDDLIKDLTRAGIVMTAFFSATVDPKHADTASAKMIAKTPDGYFEIVIRKTTQESVVDTIKSAPDAVDREVILQHLDPETERAIKESNKQDDRFS